MADVPLLTAITETFGPNMWFNTIVALTHAAAAPPDGTSGPITYDTYTRTRTQLLQQNIRCVLAPKKRQYTCLLQVTAEQRCYHKSKSAQNTQSVNVSYCSPMLPYHPSSRCSRRGMY